MREIIYTVKYKLPGPFQRSKRIKGVIGDGIIADASIRFISLQDGTIIYIPLSSEVTFSPERDIAIRDKIAKESGQK